MAISPLRACEQPLSNAYDLAMLDLDGVVYVGGETAIPGAATHLAQARAAGMRLAFVTNNAARSPEEVAGRLTALGVAADREDVVTSAQAAAGLLVERLGAGGRVAQLGGPGLEWALTDAGLLVVDIDDEPAALATGYGPDLPWRDIMRAAVAIRDGVPWVASNADATIPTRFGVAPGHGALVEMIARFAGVRPQVAGKPERPLLDETVRRVGGRNPLMVGDRLDTDIEGAHNAEVDSLLVLTGVTGLDELVAAEPGQRPTYLARDLGGLNAAQPEPARQSSRWTVGGWTAEATPGGLEVTGAGSGDDWWRAVASASWSHADETGQAPDISRLGVPDHARPAR